MDDSPNRRSPLLQLIEQLSESWWTDCMMLYFAIEAAANLALTCKLLRGIYQCSTKRLGFYGYHLEQPRDLQRMPQRCPSCKQIMIAFTTMRAGLLKLPQALDVLTRILLAVVCVLAAYVVVEAASSSYVLQVEHQPTGGQPYARALNSKQMTLAVGSGSNIVNYTFTIDTGSGIPMLACSTKESVQNCQASGGMPPSQNYVLTPQHTVSDANACSATGIGCMLPSNQCFVSEPLTGGSDFNIYNGVFASNNITFNNVLNGAPLSFKATFGCATTYIKCNQDNTSTPCYQSSTQCPTTVGSANYGQGDQVLSGSCPGSNHAVEAGWTFNVSDTPSKIAVPEQIYNAGIISQKVTGFCFQPPQKDTSCTSPLTSNSQVVLGSRLPRGVLRSRLYSAPLIPAVFPKPFPAPLAATPFTHTFRSVVTGASVPVYGRPLQPWTASFAQTNSSVSVLWDSGAYGQASVPQNVYDAFAAYYQQGYQSASRLPIVRVRGWKIEPCPNPAVMCGSNVPNTQSSCMQILFTNPKLADVSLAKRILRNMYPDTVNMVLQGGATAKLPAAYTMNICTGALNYTGFGGVAVCSYVQPASASYFWVAGHWFMGRFGSSMLLVLQLDFLILPALFTGQTLLHLVLFRQKGIRWLL